VNLQQRASAFEEVMRFLTQSVGEIGQKHRRTLKGGLAREVEHTIHDVHGVVARLADKF
jgi:hypothetical protein